MGICLHAVEAEDPIRIGAVHCRILFDFFNSSISIQFLSKIPGLQVQRLVVLQLFRKTLRLLKVFLPELTCLNNLVVIFIAISSFVTWTVYKAYRLIRLD